MVTRGKKSAIPGKSEVFGPHVVSSIRDLQQLQSYDLELASCRGTVEEIRAQLEDTEALEELREHERAERHKVPELERQLRSAEWEVEATRETMKAHEGKLYSGKVTNPKELVALHEDVTLVKARQRQQEDVALQVMVQLEEQQALHASLARELAGVEAERKELEARLTEQQRQLQAEVKQLTLQWEEVASAVPQKELDLYKKLLTTKQGRALARVERAMCQGCRINLPMTVQQQVRTNQKLVQCPSCGRVLFID